MKKFVCIICCIWLVFSNQIIFAAEEKNFEFDALLYDEIKIKYMHGQGFTGPTLTKPDYNYTTTDANEIKLLIDVINDIKSTPYYDYWGSNDGVYMHIYFGDKCELYFDVSSGKCEVGDTSYVFNKEDYVALTDVIYDLKTKNDIKLFLDDSILKPDVSPSLIDNRTLVPVRIIGEALNANVVWNDEEKSVELIKGDEKIRFIMNEDYIIKNDIVEKADVGSRLINHTAMVPIRALAEFFGFTVKWEHNSVHIWSE